MLNNINPARRNLSFGLMEVRAKYKRTNKQVHEVREGMKDLLYSGKNR